MKNTSDPPAQPRQFGEPLHAENTKAITKTTQNSNSLVIVQGWTPFPPPRSTGERFASGWLLWANFHKPFHPLLADPNGI